jgi:hypothetical protein
MHNYDNWSHFFSISFVDYQYLHKSYCSKGGIVYPDPKGGIELLLPGPYSHDYNILLLPIPKVPPHCLADGSTKHLHLPAALCHAWVQLLRASALQGGGYAVYGSVAMVAVWLLFYYNLD